MKLRPVHVFSLLTLCFLVYSMSIYLTPLFNPKDKKVLDSKAMQGRLVWQNYNCQSCHQLYGLGGYLGPDLTNTYSAQGKGEVMIRTMVNYGVMQMPAFTMSEKEMQCLLAFLKSVDATGKADPRTFATNQLGMINGSE